MYVAQKLSLVTFYKSHQNRELVYFEQQVAFTLQRDRQSCLLTWKKMATDPSTDELQLSDSISLTPKQTVEDKTNEKVPGCLKMAELIKLFQGLPCLYDIKSNAYHNQDVKKKAMEDISKVLGVDG